MVNKSTAIYVLAVAAVALLCADFRSARAAEQLQPFCARAAASRRCATPPTVDQTDSFKVEGYLGKWFEIGSTASFKLLTETGLACNQALYSASPDGDLSLLNSGLRVIGPLAVVEVSAVTVAAGGACVAARQVCNQLDDVSQLSRTLSNLSADHADGGPQLLQLSRQLESSGEAANQALDKLARDVTLIQRANGDISQAQTSSVKSSVADLKKYAKEGEQEQGVVATLASTLNKVRGQVIDIASRKGAGWSDASKAALGQVALSLGGVALKVGVSSAAIDLALKAARVSGALLAVNGSPISDGGLSSVTGSITQPDAASAGKLEVGIGSSRAPYWIIDLEKAADGTYSAALVYSCTEVAGAVASKSLFVLSREPQLQKSSLDAFLAKAESLGIYNDCEDPFLLTPQRGGDCGQPS